MALAIDSRLKHVNMYHSIAWFSHLYTEKEAAHVYERGEFRAGRAGQGVMNRNHFPFLC